ncbi:MAG: DNA polymerase domain-containing protein [candidate division WOR-3 bacterium]
MKHILKNFRSIKRPVLPHKLVDNKSDLIVQVIDYYRCLDTSVPPLENPDGDGDSGGDDGGYGTRFTSMSDEDDDLEIDQNPYSREHQRTLSYKYPLLIKLFGLMESSQSITINLQGFQPFFYIKIPDHWKQTECRILIEHVKNKVYRVYKEHLVKTEIVKRKPFKEFTGDDVFKFLKLQFVNKESYDHYARQFDKPIKVFGLNNNRAYKYDLYESNIDPIIKLIHLTKINPSGWIKIPKTKYQFTIVRTSLTDFEIDIQWNLIEPYEKMESAAINIAAFDIEANSSHGDFPIGIKNYQKLSQELITLYNEHGLTTKKTKIHRVFQRSPKEVIRTCLRLAFDDNYDHTNIHQILTQNNRKPHPETIDQLAYAVLILFEQKKEDKITSQDLYQQLLVLFESNLPPLDLSQNHGSHYGLFVEELISHLNRLASHNNLHFKKHPLEMIGALIRLAFEDFFDGFTISHIYTKHNVKPDTFLLDSLTSFVLQILDNCANFTYFKKIPHSVNLNIETSTSASTSASHNQSEQVNPSDLSQDYFVNQLTNLFDRYLPPIEGDQLIEIGTTFQLSDQPDCYLKHIICLGSCDPISNEEMIVLENKDIYLPVEELAHDLLMYEQYLGPNQGKDISPEQFASLMKQKITEIKTWDIPYRKEQCRKAAEYRRFKQSQTDHAKVIVEYYDNERDLLLAWKELILTNDPDIVIGYNVFGFDFKFLYDRACELDCVEDFCQLGRLKGFVETFHEQNLTSNGLGNNLFKYIPMTGRVIIDLYKVVQREYRLDSYKLDNVSHKFLYKEKVDLPPREIFMLQKGQSSDRKKIASYCLVDCILCNRLTLKLEIINNNIAMANVCKVPFSYLFLRGQGVKIFSLVAEYCSRNGFLIPVLPKTDPSNDDKYEGAIVLPPDKGIHFDPIGVGDFNSLYPSSMISENISHDSFVTIGGKYDNLPNYQYTDIEYDIYQSFPVPGKKKKIKKKVGVQVCRYAQLPDGKKSVLPSILMALLSARKNAKNKMEEEKDPFKSKIWNGLQLAYKITANSLYGQCGAKTSPISKVEIAASTTAVGRRMIMFSKNYIEREYKDKMVTLDLNCSGIFDSSIKQLVPTKYTGMTVHVKDSYCVYGDTDSVFIKFGLFDPQTNQKYTGLDAVSLTIAMTKKVTKEISSQLKRPQNIEFEKAIYPFILISKKRYHGHYYTKIADSSYYANSMGIALKRRDNAPIVKQVFGGAIDIIMKEQNVQKSLDFVRDQCTRLLRGEFPIELFIISKTLRSYYKKPNQIAHNVLACRQAQRDPGNRFEPNDRVPYAFIVTDRAKSQLQGDRIETPDFIKQNNLLLDYKMYITNQIMVPVSQIFELVPGYERTIDEFNLMIAKYENERSGNISLDKFIQKSEQQNSTSSLLKYSDLINMLKAKKQQDKDKDKGKETNKTIAKTRDNDVDDETDSDQSDNDDIDGADDVDVVSTSNYDDPNF